MTHPDSCIFWGNDKNKLGKCRSDLAVYKIPSVLYSLFMRYKGGPNGNSGCPGGPEPQDSCWQGLQASDTAAVTEGGQFASSIILLNEGLTPAKEGATSGRGLGVTGLTCGGGGLVISGGAGLQ